MHRECFWVPRVRHTGAELGIGTGYGILIARLHRLDHVFGHLAKVMGSIESGVKFDFSNWACCLVNLVGIACICTRASGSNLI